MNKKRFFGFGLVLVSIILSASNLTITGNVIGSNYTSYLSLFSVLSFILGAGLILAGGVQNKVIRSRVSKDSLLLRVAQDVGRRQAISRDINHLIAELNKGNTTPGLGTKTVSNGIYELRGRNGGRVYYREIEKGKYEILGYSDKPSQRGVINRLKDLYP